MLLHTEASFTLMKITSTRTKSIIQITIFPFIIFNTLFSLNVDVFKGYYSKDNFVLFLLLGYVVHSFIFLLWHYKDLFYDEKTWKTLNAIMIAPIKKVNILIPK